MFVRSRLSQWFGSLAGGEAVNDAGNTRPSAPPEAVNDTGGGIDPLAGARAGWTVLPFHANTGGFEPSWQFVQPPGVGDAPQHSYATRFLAPVGLDGPGDRPATFFRWMVPPVIANFAVRYQGMPVDGGNFLMTGLYVPQPLEMMTNDVFAGS